MAYTVNLPPLRIQHGIPEKVEGSSPIPLAPVTAVTSGDVASHVPSSAPAVPRVAEAIQFLPMTLDEFRAKGALLEVRVPWLEVSLWMVPTDRDASALMAEGVRRGQIWTASELIQLMQIAGRTLEIVKTVTHAKREMDGEIVGLRRRERSP